MNALVRKELRQVLPAQLLLTVLLTVVWLVGADPEMVLAPYAEGQFSLYALLEVFCLSEGLVLGLGQFAMERWQGTEAYLVHRGTGRSGAFRAKMFAGLASLAPIAIVPPAVFGCFHLLTQDHAGGASVASLVQTIVAGLTVVPGYALGVFVAQVRRGWLARAALALFGALTLLVALTLLAYPVAWVERIPLAWHTGIALGTGAWLLYLARREFEAGEQPMPSRRIALLRAVTAAALCLPPFALMPYVVRGSLHLDIAGDYPHIVEDEQERLYIATRTDRDRDELEKLHPGIPRAGWVYELIDAHGNRVPDDVGLQYHGLRSYRDFRADAPKSPKTFTTVYAPNWTRLTPLPEGLRWTSRQGPREPLALSGPWYTAQNQPFGWTVLLDFSDGALWVQSSSNTTPRPWTRLATLGSSMRVLEGASDAGGTPFVLCDESTGRLLRLRNHATDARALPVLEDAPLPDGDRFVAVEPLFDADAARSGAWGWEQGEVVRGTHGLYVHDGFRWLRWPEDRLSDDEGRAPAAALESLRRWSLAASASDGTGFRIDVLDARTGEPRIAYDFRPTTPRQRTRARMAELACLAHPPAVVLASWASPKRQGANVFSSRLGLTQVDELRGRNRTWIVVVSLLLAAALTRNLWRRLSEADSPLELRLWWCVATALLGLPAYVLCRLIEPRAARAPRPGEPREQREPRFVIRTA